MELIKKLLSIALSKKKINLVSEQDLLAQRLLMGKMLANQLKLLPVNHIQDAEFSVFSQWGDDGIIQYLVQQLDIPVKVFVEFGVENYRESNTRFLLYNNNWKGLVMDGSQANIDFIRKEYLYCQFAIRARQQFVTAENIDQTLREEKISGEIGLLHIDIDGNDYWVWKAIQSVNPVIVIMEYNSAFGAERAVSVPYDPTFFRTTKHTSNLYFGASLEAFRHLGKERGYEFIGSNSNGNNAYFIRKDKSAPLAHLIEQAGKGYVKSHFREHRDAAGALTWTDWEDALGEIAHLPLTNVVTGAAEQVGA